MNGLTRFPLSLSTNLYKKSLTESWGPWRIGTSLSLALGSGLVGASVLSGHPPDTWRTPVVYSLARVVGALPGSTSFPPYSWEQIMDSKTKSKEQKQANKENKRPRRIADSGTDVESEPRVMLTPVKRHKRASSTSSETSDEKIRNVGEKKKEICRKLTARKQVALARLSWRQSPEKGRNSRSSYLMNQIR